MAQISCPKCHRTMAADARFCSNCGTPLSGGESGPRAKAAAGKTAVRDVAIIVGVLVVVAVAYFVFREKPAPAVPPASPTQSAASGAVDQSNPHAGMQGMTAGFLDSLPKDYNSLVGLGNDNMDQGNFPLAAECYRRALEIDGNSADVRTDYGACLHGMGLPNRAIEEFKRVLVESPKHGIANFNLGIVYREIGQNDSAKAYWNKYLKFEPNGQVADAARKYLKELGG